MNLKPLIVVGEVANTTFLHRATFETLLNLGAFSSGPSRERLIKHGIDFERCSSMNLCSPGRWDPEEACTNAHMLVGHCLRTEEERRILAFGARTAWAFGLKFDPFRQKQVGCVTITVLPHPSGLSRFWNDPDNVRRFEEYVRGLT